MSKRKLENADNTGAPAAKVLKAAYQRPVLKVKKLTENAKTPVKGSEYSAGYDLHAAYDVIVPSNGKALVKTDIAISIPHNCYGRIAPRSGLAWKHHIDIGAGVIDSDYRGNVGVVMFNHNNKDFNVTKHMRIAQLILERYESNAILIECDDLDDTVRGHGGFGSTGTHSTHNTNGNNNNNNNNNNNSSNDKDSVKNGDIDTIVSKSNKLDLKGDSPNIEKKESETEENINKNANGNANAIATQ